MTCRWNEARAKERQGAKLEESLQLINVQNVEQKLLQESVEKNKDEQNKKVGILIPIFSIYAIFKLIIIHSEIIL